MTPEEIDKMQADEKLEFLVAKAMGQTDFNHMTFQWEEGHTENGEDGWEGFVCPRCGYGNIGGRCVKAYSRTYKYVEELLKWILANTGDFFIERWKDPKDNMWFLCNLAQPVRKLPYNQKLAIAATSDKVADDELPNLPLALCRYILKVKLAHKEE